MAKFPQHYKPRPYQADLHQMWQTKTYGIGVYPRQSGKDMAAINEQSRARLATPKTTGLYIGLSNPEIANIIWNKTYLCPDCGEYVRALRDEVPSTHVKWKETLKEGHYHNQSWLKLLGFFQSGQDKGGVGTSFQDYTITELALFMREDPVIRIQPIIENNPNTRLMAVSTPRGKRHNPLWKLMESVQGRKDAQVIVRTIDDINEMMVRSGQPAIVTQEKLEEIRDSYRKRFGNDRMFEQEYYCSFEEMDAAAVYGEAYMAMVNEGRVHKFNLDPRHPVYVVFDIGSSGKHSDATSWIAFQYINGRKFIYDCGEGHGKALPEYVDVLATKHWFNQIGFIILPWDGDHHEKAVNTTPADMMRQRFPRVRVLAKSNKVYRIPGSRSGDYDIVTDIQQTRMSLYNTIIHGTLTERAKDTETESGIIIPGGVTEIVDPGNCQWLLECLENYKYEFNTKLQQWSDVPLHDKYSHMMDALRYADQAIKELEFFGDQLFDQGGVSNATDHTSGWSNVWHR